MNIDSTIEELTALSIDERLKVVAAVWNIIDADAGPPALSAELKAELDRRLDAHEKNPADLLTWDQVLEKLRGRL
ncbi:MAG: addiction module protein [Pirellulales bacterium]